LRVLTSKRINGGGSEASSPKRIWLRSSMIGEVDSPTLLSFLNFKVSQHSSRSTPTFYIPLNVTNYMENKPIKRLMFNDDETDAAISF